MLSSMQLGYDRKYDFLAEDALTALHQTDEGIPLYTDTIPTVVQVSIGDLPTGLLASWNVS